MLLGEPQRTQGDLNFRIMDIPVRVSPWFWLLAALFGWNATDDDPYRLLIWIAAVFLSILIHELGHAVAFRYFGAPCHVVLYQFGGLTVPDTYGSAIGLGRVRRPGEQLIISAAGPILQMAIAFAVMLAIAMSGREVPFFGFLASYLPFPDGEPLSSTPFYFLAYFLLVSIYWALLNLLPVYPLDGGQIARELFLLFDRGDAVKHSLIVSVITGGAVALYGLMNGSLYLGILFGMLAYSSYTTLQAYSGHGGGFGGFGGHRGW